MAMCMCLHTWQGAENFMIQIISKNLTKRSNITLGKHFLVSLSKFHHHLYKCNNIFFIFNILLKIPIINIWNSINVSIFFNSLRLLHWVNNILLIYMKLIFIKCLYCICSSLILQQFIYAGNYNILFAYKRNSSN